MDSHTKNTIPPSVAKRSIDGLMIKEDTLKLLHLNGIHYLGDIFITDPINLQNTIGIEHYFVVMEALLKNDVRTSYYSGLESYNFDLFVKDLPFK